MQPTNHNPSTQNPKIEGNMSLSLSLRGLEHLLHYTRAPERVGALTTVGKSSSGAFSTKGKGVNVLCALPRWANGIGRLVLLRGRARSLTLNQKKFKAVQENRL